jgi:predicted RNA-binding Zn ribbon-like protein
MTTAICAEGLARVVGAGEARRLGTCADVGCERVFIDVSKNGSRRFCSTTCQNRVKAAAFRERHAVG